MASPLQILGDIGGGLSTIGAQGSGGAYEGVLEGEALKRKFSASDADTNLRILQGLLMQQQLGPQYHTDPQGRTFLIRPGQPPQFWGFSPPAPPTPTQQAQMEKYTKEAKLAETRTNVLQNPKDTKLETPITAIERKAMASGPDSLTPGERAVWDAHHKPAPTADKYPMSLEGQRAKANDPTVPEPERARAKQMADAIEKSRINIAGAESQTRANISENVAARKEGRKLESQIGPMETAVTQMKGQIDQLESEGFLPKPVKEGDWAGAAREIAKARAHQIAFGRFSPAWQKWITNQGVLIGIDRSVFNDIGRGGQMMYSAVKEFSEHPPTADAMREVFKQWDASIAARRGGSGEGGGMGVGGQAKGGGIAEGLPPLPDPATRRGQTVEDGETGLRFYSDGLAWHRAGGAQSQPTAPGAQQGASVGLPKGAHREGGEIISDSGKYVWRNGAWQAR